MSKDNFTTKLISTKDITIREADISNLDTRSVIFPTKINSNGTNVEPASQIHNYGDSSQDHYIQVVNFANISKLERLVMQIRLKNAIVDIKMHLSFAATVFCNNIFKAL